MATMRTIVNVILIAGGLLALALVALDEGTLSGLPASVQNLRSFLVAQGASTAQQARIFLGSAGPAPGTPSELPAELAATPTASPPAEPAQTMTPEPSQTTITPPATAMDTPQPPPPPPAATLTATTPADTPTPGEPAQAGTPESP